MVVISFKVIIPFSGGHCDYTPPPPAPKTQFNLYVYIIYMHIDVRLDGRKLRVVIIEKSILDDKKGAECHAKIEAETGSLKDREISCRLKDYQRLNKDCTARSLFRLHVF